MCCLEELPNSVMSGFFADRLDVLGRTVILRGGIMGGGDPRKAIGVISLEDIRREIELGEGDMVG